MTAPRSIQVVAGVITDPRGRILLTRRKEDSELAGLWEFPGGKIEPGESPEQALRRELLEEVGLEVEVGTPVIRVPQLYPSKRLTLDVRHVTVRSGHARGCEGQALTWVAPEKLRQYSMPHADLPVVAALTQPAEYAITPDIDAPFDEIAIERWVVRALALCAVPRRRVQLRSPQAPRDRFALAIERLLERLGSQQVQLLVNRDTELAAQFGLGLHWCAVQLHQATERPSISSQQPLAVSCHHLADLERAQSLQCDFAVLSPVLATQTHPTATPLGWDGFAGLREHVSLPLYALGGLQPDDLVTARYHGAQGIAGIRGFAGEWD